MKLLAILFCAAALFGCQSIVSQSHQTTLALRMDNGTCSGTAVGRHVLLTAAHCLIGESHLAINGSPAAVKKVINDGHDHALVVVDSTFSHWAFVGDEPAQGDEVYLIGNPGVFADMYRHGYVSGSLVRDGVKVTLYELPIYFGDSGSGIFNEKGQLVGVVSGIAQQVEGAYFSLGFSFALSFSADQWRQALN